MTPASTRTISRPASGAGSLLLVAALVMGVLGMHAFSTVCSGSGDVSVTVASPTLHHTAADAGVPTGHEPAPRTAAHDADDDRLSSGGAMSICLAVLFAVGSLWLALALRRSVRGWRIARVRAPRTPRLSATALPRPPPSLARLSILRC